MGIGNAAPNFLNENLVRQARNVLTGDFHNAQAAATYLLRGRGSPNQGLNNTNTPLAAGNPAIVTPPPIDGLNLDPGDTPVHVTTPRPLRTPTNASRAYNRQVRRTSERVVPARDRGVEYLDEAARHRPLPRNRNGVGNRNGNGDIADRSSMNTGLIGTPDPSGRERAGRIELWRSSITG